MKGVIFDKDGTLVRPASGNKFVQHPEDQELIPGVAQRIAGMAADGWQMAIAISQHLNIRSAAHLGHLLNISQPIG